MPELPDITIYVERLKELSLGQALRKVKLVSPFVLRTALPPIDSAEGHRVADVRRLGKRIVLSLEGDLHVVIHLMVAGRLHWFGSGKKAGGRNLLASFDFSNGTLTLTEAGTRRRASIHLVHGDIALAAIDPGGIEPLEATPAAFAARLTDENHTLKRALTDPKLFSGIGNAYSDEILHRAKLSPIAMTQGLETAEVTRLFEATHSVLTEWTRKLRTEAGEFPENVTAFRDEFAVHGKYGKACPVCGAPVQRIRYADNETNYCARCQTGGKILADRSLSRLLKKSWPRSIDELG